MNNWLDFLNANRPHVVVDKNPPCYALEKDIWYNERNNKLYHVDIEKCENNGEETIPFSPKCMVKLKSGWKKRSQI